MAEAFHVTAAASKLELAAGERTAVFNVSNKLGRDVRVRAVVRPEGSASSTWFRILGETELDLATDGNDQYVVSIDVPPNAPAGTFRFTLIVQDIENPDDVWSEGQPVEIVVGGGGTASPSLPSGRGFPWWAIGVAGAATVLLSALIAFFVARGAVPDETGGPFLPLSGGELSGDLLLERGVELSCEGCVSTDELAAGSVTSNALAAGSVGSPALTRAAVGSEQLAAGAVTRGKLGVTCRDGEVLKFEGGKWGCAADLVGGGGGGPALSVQTCKPNEVLVATSPTKLECKKLEYDCDFKATDPLAVPGGSKTTTETYSVTCDPGTFALAGWRIGLGDDANVRGTSAITREDGRTVDCTYTGYRRVGTWQCAAACCRVIVR